MLGAAVIPEGYGIVFPAEAALEIHAAGNMVVDHLQYVFALIAAQFHDPRGEGLINVQSFAACHRVGAHDGMDGLRILAIR